MHHNRAPSDIEARWNEAIGCAQKFIESVAPDLLIIFFPDHLNGFFYDLLPPFCIGAAGESLGDFGTVPGPIDIPESLAADCHSYCVVHDMDVAISYNMLIDHGATQAFESLVGNSQLTGFVPIFINCIAPPMPSFSRARALGRIIGEWASQRLERILIIGSGGLSHDPPLPSLKAATGQTAERLRKGGALSYGDRILRQHRVLAEGKMLRAGQSSVMPLNPEWDRTVLAELAAGKLDRFDHLGSQEIKDVAGNGAHELRTWIACLAAFETLGGFQSQMTFYEAVDEWITGMGLLIAQPRLQGNSAQPGGA
jgi:2,3-dihydroxyphenylpropionate 1,2-dioxygenase